MSSNNAKPNGVEFSSSLDQQETPSQADRLRFARQLSEAGLSLAAVSSFQACGRDLFALYQPEPHPTVRIVAATCKSKWCPRCAAARAAIIRENLDRTSLPTPMRLITLTQRHTDEPLRVQIDRLFESFNRVRRCPNWKRCVRGGCYFLELTRNRETHQWHPHLHLLTSGCYYDQGDLRKDWLKASGSHVVHITLVRSTAAAKAYVTKYLTKPINYEEQTPQAAITEAIRDLHARRLVGTFGAWRTFKLLTRHAQPKAVFLGWMNELKIRALEGDTIAAALIEDYRALDTTSLEISWTPSPELRQALLEDVSIAADLNSATSIDPPPSHSGDSHARAP